MHAQVGGALKEFRGKYEALAKDDTAGRRSLARWCAGKSLRQREIQLYREIIALAPEDAVARKALGHIKDGDAWYDDNAALQRAKGKSPRLKTWEALAKPTDFTLVHGHYLTAEEVARLDKGEALEGHALADGNEVLTREYLVVSALARDKSLELGRMLEQALRAWRTAAACPFDAAKRQTLAVRILKSNEAFVAMIKGDIETFDQELVKAQGFFDGETCWMSYFHDWYRTGRVMLHECRHQFDCCVSRTMGRMPGWYMEGTAEYWSVHEWNGKELKTGVLNADNNENMYFAVKLAKSRKLRGAEETLKHPWPESINPVFYQNSWAFIYFLRTSKDYSAGFEKWETNLLQGKYRTPEDQLAGFKELVAQDLKAFDKAYIAAIKDMDDLVPAKWK